MRNKIKGLFCPIITVFNEDESFNEEETRKQVDFLIEKGVQGLVPSGSTGEFIALTLEERKQLIKAVIDETRGRVPVYAAPGHYSTKITLELCRFSKEAGADGIMVIAPYYLLPPRNEIMEHYRTIAQEIDLPLMIYNNIHFAGVELSMEEIAQLCQEGICSSVKVGHGDPGRVHDLKHYCGDKLTVFYGHDICAFEGLVAGADGWIAGIANFIPENCRALFDAVYYEHNIEKGREIWHKILPIIHMCTKKRSTGRAPFLQIMKEGLKMRGVISSSKVRRPGLELDEKDRTKLTNVMTDIGLI